MKNCLLSRVLPVVSLVLLLVSCTDGIDYRTFSERIGLLNNDTKFFYASIEMQVDSCDGSRPGTKVYADGQMRVLWNGGDRISIFNRNTYNQCWQFNGLDGDNAGGFTKVPKDMYATGNPLSEVYAAYPYTDETKISNDGVISLTLPSEQIFKEDSFGIGANTMVSIADGEMLLFKNVGGYLSFKFFGEDVSVREISLKGNDGEALAGRADVTILRGAAPQIVFSGEPVEEIRLLCESPVDLDASSNACTEFWFVIPPVTFNQGFTVTIKDDHGGVFEKSLDKSLSIIRNTLTRMAPLEVVPVSSGPGPDDPISFADGNVKSALLAKGIDTSGDGDISYAEAAAVTTIEKDFFGAYAKNVSCFDEFRFFTSVKSIEENAFKDCTFSSIQLPEGLETIEQNAFVRCRQLQSIHIPDGVWKIGSYAFLACNSLEDVTLPANLTEMGTSIFYACPFTEIDLPEKMPSIGYSMFSNCKNLKKIYLPPGITSIGPEAFNECTSLVEVTGGDNLNEIGFRSFEYCTGLKEFHIPESVTTFGDGPFFDCTSLERFTGKYVSEDGRSVIKDGTLIAFAFSGAMNISYEVPPQVTSIGGYVFFDCAEMVSIVLHENVRSLGDNAFGNCTGLKSITIPSKVRTIKSGCFSGCTSLEHIEFPEGLTELDVMLCSGCTSLRKVTIPSTVTIFYNNVFFDCTALGEVTCKATTPPALRNSRYVGFDRPQDSFTNTPDTMRILVPSASVGLYRQTEIWSDHSSQIIGVDFPDINSPDFYVSSDFSQDGVPFTIQRATEGAGINIVLMGDCFVDKDIADGSYRAILEHASDVFFSVEPYASFRHLFNVYGVNVVSNTEGYAFMQGALSTWFGNGTLVGGNDATVREYAMKALPDGTDLSKTLIIVMMNRDYYAGTCYMYYNRTADYGQGMSIAYFPLGTDESMFAGLIHHEAGGHGFAKLADEYNYSSPISDSQISSYRSQEPYGWWKNVDFTSEPESVKWSAFLFDSRYAEEGLGVYEGACTYASGAYRPSVNSIMRHNTGGFNAPSREAIYYRIHKLAYGNNWQYDREAFVAYDAINRAAAAVATMGVWEEQADKLPPLAPPVVIEEYSNNN